jgi:hypothetical protein
METKNAYGVSFKPGKAAYVDGGLGRIHVRALFHEIHQLGAIKIPNKQRLKIVRLAHLNCLSALSTEHLNIAGFRATSSASAEMKRRTNSPPLDRKIGPPKQIRHPSKWSAPSPLGG